jgi:hypothetical protein
MPKKTLRSFTKLSGSKTGLVASALIGLVILLAISEVTGLTHIFHKTPVPPVIPVTSTVGSANPVTPDNTQSPTEPSKSPAKDKGQTDNSQTTSLPLHAPSGNFVSNHSPGQNGSPTQESSVCNTTPGASCYIRFNKGSSTTALPTRKTDDGGTAYWQWDVKSAKLSAGDWTVTAVATLNGQTKSTMDPIPLHISQ